MSDQAQVYVIMNLHKWLASKSVDMSSMTMGSVTGRLADRIVEEGGIGSTL